jgi:hypothetical protein
MEVITTGESKSLKGKLPNVPPEYFDTLLTIQEVTSEKVHEESYDGWGSLHLKGIIAALVEALTEIYVIPEAREKRRKEILKLRNEIQGKQNARESRHKSGVLVVGITCSNKRKNYILSDARQSFFERAAICR